MRTTTPQKMRHRNIDVMLMMKVCMCMGSNDRASAFFLSGKKKQSSVPLWTWLRTSTSCLCRVGPRTQERAGNQTSIPVSSSRGAPSRGIMRCNCCRSFYMSGFSGTICLTMCSLDCSMEPSMSEPNFWQMSRKRGSICSICVTG